jgi:hypothetical protein
MSEYKMICEPFTIRITGFAHNQPVWAGNRLKIYNGPTMELTISSPLNSTKQVNIPFPISHYSLKISVGRWGPVMSRAEVNALDALIISFAKYIAANHYWDEPYRPKNAL